MLLLAIDTSGKQGSIALARAEEGDAPNEIEIIEIMPLVGGTFSAQLIPQISALISSNGYNKEAIGAFAAVSGPGSFTGIRIGLAAVKGLAEILNKPIAAVSMLEVIEFAGGVEGKIMPALDAGRNQVYIGRYEPAVTGHAVREEVVSLPNFLSQAEGWNVVTPDMAIAEAARGVGLPVSLLLPISADAVARVGWSKIRSGATETPEQLEANYIRCTDAENLEKGRTQLGRS
jgi:tRNA threonylcarbamoyladenosine biosynthesis protein TsaB